MVLFTHYLLCFSALQRAENSSIDRDKRSDTSVHRFQCSSASRKFLNRTGRTLRTSSAIAVSVLFSEPKIPQSNVESSALVGGVVSVLFSEPKIPQSCDVGAMGGPPPGFSALQRAENSSMFSTPARVERVCYVSVLFSEPKIPQFADVRKILNVIVSFSALQRAENSSIWTAWRVFRSLS